MFSMFHRLNAGEAVFDFIGKRKRWYLASGLLLLICVGSFVFRGFNLGVEFSGGTQFQFKAVAVQPEEVQQVAESAGAVVANTPQFVGAAETRSVVVKAAELDPAAQTKVKDALQTRFGQQVTVQAVSSSWGTDITKSAIRALVIFLIAVCIFIAIRFEWKMAVGAIVALFHDLLLTAGIYSIIGFEVTPSTVVGLLTILGFSLYDTVVVFDKVEENSHGILGGSRHHVLGGREPRGQPDADALDQHLAHRAAAGRRAAVRRRRPARCRHDQGPGAGAVRRSGRGGVLVDLPGHADRL